MYIWSDFKSLMYFYFLNHFLYQQMIHLICILVLNVYWCVFSSCLGKCFDCLFFSSLFIWIYQLLLSRRLSNVVYAKHQYHLQVNKISKEITHHLNHSFIYHNWKIKDHLNLNEQVADIEVKLEIHVWLNKFIKRVSRPHSLISTKQPTLKA